MKNIIYLLLFFISILSLLFSLPSCSDDSGAFDPISTGTGGSMARFSIQGNYLYMVDNQKLQVFDIQDQNRITPLHQQEVGFRIETIFAYKDNLYIGSEIGTYIYSLEDPVKPVQLSELTHFTPCLEGRVFDPVVVKDDFAYITLRTSGACNLFGANRLEIVDVSNPTTPEILREHNMVEPKGMGIVDSILFLCDGQAGLKIFNIENPLNMGLISQIEDFDAYDVIPLDNTLLMIGDDGFAQYDYSNLPELKKLSEILIGE